MVWRMSCDEDKNGTVAGGETKAENQPKKSLAKYVVIGVSVVTFLAMVLIGALVGVYLFTDAFNKVLTQTLKTKASTEQEMNVDLTTNIIEYNVKGDDGTAVYVEDYNTFLRVVKMTSPREVVCYAGHMNGTDKADLTKVQKTTDENSLQNETDNTVSYVRIGDPIPDISFMNRKARELCKGISTYWVQHSCVKPSVGHNHKRSLCFYLWYICYWRYPYYVCYYEYYIYGC